MTLTETGPATQRRPFVERPLGLIALIAAVAFAIGALLTGVHVATCEEDACVVWVCAWMGDGNCGPDTPAVDVRIPPPAWAE